MRMRSLEKDDDCIMTIKEFDNAVKAGDFIDYDGFGHLATKKLVSDVEVRPSTFNKNNLPSWATHVVWYNR